MRARALVGVIGSALLLFACGSSDEEAAPTPPPSTGGSGGGGAAGAGGSAGGAGTSGGAGGSATGICDADMAKSTLDSATSPCVFKCAPSCSEATTPWTCPALAPYGSLPHDCADTACGNWDGTYPAPVQGKCTASTPSGEAIAKADANRLPDGRAIQPAGTELIFPNDPTMPKGSFPFSAIRYPGTPYVIVSDDGYDDHYLRVVDTEKLAAGMGEAAIVSTIPYACGSTPCDPSTNPKSLNLGLAIGKDGSVYAASGAPDAVVRGYSFDTKTGALAHVAALDVNVGNDEQGAPLFPFAIAISPDGKTLLVGEVNFPTVYAFSLEQATYGQKLFTIDPGGNEKEHFSIVFDPKSSTLAYASLWRGSHIVELDLAAKTAKKIATGPAPAKIVFLDDNYLVVADAFGDDLSIVDRAAGTSTQIPIDPNALHGSGPSSIAYDAASKRLYATLSGRNAVAAFDVTPSPAPGTPPVLAPAGLIPTSWWPTEVLVDGPMDPKPGALVILDGKGHGGGPQPMPWHQLWAGLDGELMHGSIQRVDMPDAASLAASTMVVEKANSPAKFDGAPTVSCPAGADYDFPIPQTNTEGPSKQIEHVILIVRENKTYDDILGDLPNADGDPNLVMAPGQMDDIWPNFRKAVQAFATSDNYYEDAEQSLQGHYWTSFGRTSDYCERTWLSTWGRGTRSAIAYTDPAGQPEEGSIFGWLDANKVPFDDMGELVGGKGLDLVYGTVSTSNLHPTDTESACYMALRARSLCNLKAFTYAWFVDDHTFGGSAGKPNPGLMISVNDEGTGMFLDGLSHSPLWKNSLLVVIEDDPQDGADHVDAHRSVILLASPWVKRGYVSHTHMDVSSIHKLVAHVFGIPYNNQLVADAALPLDLFTSTPDYTPYDYVPRKWQDLSCNAPHSKAAQEAAKWDFSEPDEQPGLGVQVRRLLQGME